MSARGCSGRSDVLAREGMVATSQPLATQAGIAVLMMGGNAVDAAVAAAAVLGVVEPFSTGCGGDAFGLVHEPGASRPIAYNGSGISGSGTTLDELRRKYSSIPARGGPPVTVPGALHLWATLIDRHGALELADVLQPAIRYARSGFPVSPIVSRTWASATGALVNDSARRTFLRGDRPPATGDVMSNPDLAVTYERIAEEGVDVFYRGDMAEKIVETVREHGGFLTMEDMKRQTTEETVPISIDYRGIDVFEHGPNGQGFAVLEMLRIMEEYDLPAFPLYSPDRYHIMLEAKKLAYADLYQHNADPHFYRVPLDMLLSREYAKRRRMSIDMTRAMPIPCSGVGVACDTVYLAAADASGRAVSLINSLYMAFGSGLVVPGTGILLQNRGTLFSLDPLHPNHYAPNKRPFHTIIPGALYRDGDLMGVFGVMGGDHQAQAHAQVVSNVVDHGLGPQMAIDHPRFHHDQATDTLVLEMGHPRRLLTELRRRGHNLIPNEGRLFGGGQMILRQDSIWVAGSDRRKDGQACGF